MPPSHELFSPLIIPYLMHEVHSQILRNRDNPVFREFLELGRALVALVDSSRSLIGENSEAFVGTIRIVFF